MHICAALRDLVPFVQFKNVKNTHGCFSHFLNRTNGTKSRKTSNYIADRDKLLFCEDGEDKLVNKLFLRCYLVVPRKILSPHRGDSWFWTEPRPSPSLSQTEQPMGFKLATRQFRRNALIHFSSILPFLYPLKHRFSGVFRRGGGVI